MAPVLARRMYMLCSNLLRPAAICLILSLFAPLVLAQQTVNGQVFTHALAIVDAPAVQSTQHVGSTMSIAIDISGDGKLPPAAAIPGSGLATQFNSLEIYLVSSQTNINLTVSQGPGLLTQEPGSTVKHLNFDVPDCVTAGDYNLTVYESSLINNQAFFSITPIPITVQHSGSSSANCGPSLNTLQAQPQPESPPASNPWLALQAASTTIATSAVSPPSALPGPTVTGPITITVQSSVSWPFTTVVSNGAEPSTVTVSAPAVTVTDEPPSMTVTVVFVSLQTVTTTVPGGDGATTKTMTMRSTTTAIMQPSASASLAGFFPVSAAERTFDRLVMPWAPSFTVIAVAGFWTLTYYVVS